MPGDIGRSIGVLDRFLGGGALESKVSTVIHELSAVQEEILASNRRWYALKVSPYKTLDHAIRGALITLVDIDIRKRALDITRDVGAYAAKFLGAIDHPLLILDRNLRVAWASDVFLSRFQLSAEETIGSVLASLGTGQLADPGLRERLEWVFTAESLLRGYELRLRSPDGAERTARVGASLIPVATDVPLALVSIESTPRGASRGEP
jgi:two-component system, chemotaxis family, CheB/CheR fusion protein